MNITPKDLLDAGVHFGHQTKRWNPRFKEYLFDHRQGVSIIDLIKTHACLERAYAFVEDLVADGGDVLMVGTKRQAQEIVREAATSTGMPFSVNRWMGGTLTNFETIKRSIAKYKGYQEMEASGELAKMHKKEASAIKREMERMHRNFEGLSSVDKIPACMLVIDINYEDIAVAEGRRVGMPVVALVDTNSNPAFTDYPIPGNDDAVKSIRLIMDVLVEAIQSGLSQRDSRRIAQGQQQVADSRVAAPIQPFIPGTPAAEEAAPPAPAAEQAPAPAPEAPPAEQAPAPAPEAPPAAPTPPEESNDDDDDDSEDEVVVKRPSKKASASDDDDDDSESDDS